MPSRVKDKQTSSDSVTAITDEVVVQTALVLPKTHQTGSRDTSIGMTQLKHQQHSSSPTQAHLDCGCSAKSKL
jgi:hypothetical protein